MAPRFVRLGRGKGRFVLVASFAVATAVSGVVASYSSASTSNTSVGYANGATVANSSATSGGGISAVGSLARVSTPAGAGPATLSVDPQHIGDLMLFGAEVSNSNPPTVSGVSGGGVSSWRRLARNTDTNYTQDDLEIWAGVVTKTGSSVITMTVSGFSDGDDLMAQEFTDGGPATWSFDKSGNVTGTSAQDFNYPSLTPAGASELYFGMGTAINDTQLVGDGTAGVTYVETGLECVSLALYDTAASATLAPRVANADGGGNWEAALAVLGRATRR